MENIEKVNCTNCGWENPSVNKYCRNCGYELPKIVVQAPETIAAEPDTFTTRINKRKGLVGALLGIVLFPLVIYAFQHLFFNHAMMNRFMAPAFDKVMTAAAKEMSKKCPMMVDNITRLDIVKALPGKVLEYDYTLIGINKEQVNMDAFKEKIEPQIVETIKTSPQMQIFRSNQTIFVYNYRDGSGETIVKISVTPDMYVE